MSKTFSLKSKYFVTSDGVKLHYLMTQRTKSSVELIFIHGLGNDSLIWSKVQENLFEKGYSSVAIDIRGHGLSDDPAFFGSYHFDLLTKDIVELVINLKIKNTVLIGHSLGGMISMYLAGKKLLPLEGQILIETSYRVNIFGLPEIINEKLAHALASLAYVFPNGYTNKHDRYQKFADTHDLDISRIASDIQTTSLRSYLFACSQAAIFDARALLSSIAVPTLVIAGENDLLTTPESMVDLKNKIPYADFAIIPDVNHIIATSDPDNLARIILKFVKKL